jgi:two-component system phosphate regulon response regulator PhoB
MAKIFVVEDNPGLSEAIVSYLEIEGHSVVLFERLAGLMEAVRMAGADLIVLDVMLPDGDGFMMARRIRKESKVPIMFLTARSSESDRITGFEIGADDYVVKPFSMRELVLRVRTILARTMSAKQVDVDLPRSWRLVGQQADHLLMLDDKLHVASHDGKEIKLTATEWKLVAYMAEREMMVVSREQLLGSCLDYLAEGSERSINTHMKNIRAKLGGVEWIETVRGFGYRFVGKAVQS